MQKTKTLLCLKSIILVAYMTEKIVYIFKLSLQLRNSRSKLLLLVPVTGVV